MLLRLKNLYWQKLSYKFLGITFLATGVSFVVLFIWLSRQQEEHIMEQVRKQAIILYKQILVTRQWVAEHNSVLVAKTDGIGSSRFLDVPEARGIDGTVYTKVSPSMLTKILSDKAAQGGMYYFKLTNTERLNPDNVPDELEKEALNLFRTSFHEGFFRTEKHGNAHVMRYIAPVYVSENCIQCHQRQYYKPGEVGGCLSVYVPMDEAKSAIFHSKMILVGGVSGIALSLVGLVFIGARWVVFKRINDIRSAISGMGSGKTTPSAGGRGDELKDIGDFCYYLNEQLKERHEDLERKIAEATRDLSETNKNLENANKDLESLNRAKSEFFSDISHELRTPLTNIKGAADILVRKASCEDPEYLDIIKRNADHLTKIVLDFLDYSKMEAGRLELDREIAPLRIVADEAILAHKAEAVKKGVNITLHCSEDISCFFDMRRIFQVFTNLLSNSIKFSPENETIKVKVNNKDGDWVTITVADNGPGIESGYHEAIFNKFCQLGDRKDLHEGSAGIGLAICKGIVEAHGGKIWVAGKSAKGSAFSFTLPKRPLPCGAEGDLSGVSRPDTLDVGSGGAGPK
jgi:signal transduction histidine kinase